MRTRRCEVAKKRRRRCRRPAPAPRTGTGLAGQSRTAAASRTQRQSRRRPLSRIAALRATARWAACYCIARLRACAALQSFPHDPYPCLLLTPRCCAACRNAAVVSSEFCAAKRTHAMRGFWPRCCRSKKHRTSDRGSVAQLAGGSCLYMLVTSIGHRPRMSAVHKASSCKAKCRRSRRPLRGAGSCSERCVR